MSQELLYTSAPHGLKPGSRGFCTVLSTQGMAAPLASALEGLSGYRPVFPPGDEQHDLNPITWSHVTMAVAGRNCHILSRVAEYGLDYSQRTNKLAHHVVLDGNELITAGPAALLRSAGFMRDEWNEEPHLTPTKPVPPIPPRPPGVCQAWKDLTGDGGWAGVLAESFLRDAERPIILLYAPGQDMLPLIAEALSLIPANRRWEVTFTTYFTGLPQTVNCNWRCMLHDSPEAHQSLRFVRALRLDLTDPDRLGMPAGNELVADARGIPRLKTGSQGTLPPLPLTSGTESFAEHTASEMDANSEFEDVPPLPDCDIYPVQPSLKRSSQKQRDGQLSSAAAEAHFARRRKVAALIGGVGLVTLLLIGLAVGITRSAQNHPENPSPDQSPQRTNSDVVRPRVVENRSDPEGKQTKAGDSQPKTADSKPSPPPTKSELVQSEAAEQPPAKSSPEVQDPTKVSAPPVADDPAPADHHANVDVRKKQDQVLLSLSAKQNPFSSIALFSPESVHLSGETRLSDIGLHFEIKVTGALEDSPFVKIFAKNSTIASDKGRSRFALTMDLVGDYRSQIGRLDWCEIDVQNRNPQPPVTRIRFHDFPLDDAHLKAKFKKDKEGLQATWDLGIVAETNVPEMQMKNLLVSIGSVEYRFLPAPPPIHPMDDVLATFQSPDLKSALVKVLKDVDEAKIADSFKIKLKKLGSSGDDASRNRVAFTLHLNVDSQIEKAFSITPLIRATAKSSCETATTLLIQCRRNINPKNSILDFNKGTNSAEVAIKVETAISRLKTHNEWLSSVHARNDGEKKLLVATNEAVKVAFENLNKLKERCDEIARFELGLEQIEVRSSDLHYFLDSPNRERRPVFIFKTSSK